MLEGLWPYWLPAPGLEGAGERRAVQNTVALRDGLLLLTGANMSGKSTLMRATMAAVILANVGLPVPAESARVPQVCSRAPCSLPHCMPGIRAVNRLHDGCHKH